MCRARPILPPADGREILRTRAMMQRHRIRRVVFTAVLALLACSNRVVDGSGAGSSGAATGTTTGSTTTTGTQTSLGGVATTASPEPTTAGSVGDSFGSSTSHDDDPPADPQLECDLWAQDCKPGFKCAGWANDGGDQWNATRCVPIARPSAAVGEPCTVSEWIASGADDCEIGAMCWHIDPVTLHGTCVPLCQGSEMNWSCPGLCTPCDIANEGTLLLCVPPCNPLAPTCGLGERCLGESSGWFASIACHRAPPGTSGIGELCHDSWDCVDGLLCVDDDEYPGCAVSPGCCTPYCDRAAADPCDGLVPGTSCEPFYPGDAAPAGCGVDELGLCRLPRP